MVISGIGIHDIQDMIATADQYQGSAWVSLTQKGGQLSGVNIFINGGGQDAFARAQRMADAINAAISGNPVTQEELA